MSETNHVWATSLSNAYFFNVVNSNNLLQTTYNLIQHEVLSHVFPAMLKNNTHSRLMNYLWHINPYLTLRGFVDAHSDINCLLRTVEICEDLKVTQ